MEELDIQKIVHALVAELSKEAEAHTERGKSLRAQVLGVTLLYERIRQAAENIQPGTEEEPIKPASGPNGHVPGAEAVGVGSSTRQGRINTAPAAANNRRIRG